MTTTAPNTTSQCDLTFSPRSSVSGGSSGGACSIGSSTSSSLPRRRIRCNGQHIAVGERRFQSATDALVAYLRQFDEGDGDGADDSIIANGPGFTLPEDKTNGVGRLTTSLGANNRINSAGKGGVVSGKGADTDLIGNPLKVGENNIATENQKFNASLVGKSLAGTGLVLASNGIALAGSKHDVEDLLTSKVSTEIQGEITDTLREVKLRRLLKQAALKSKDQAKTGLQQEVEAALIRSAELLEKVTREDLPSTRTSTQDDALNTSSCNTSSLNLELEALLLGNDASYQDPAGKRDDQSDDEGDDVRSLLSLPSTSGRKHTYSYRTSRLSKERQRLSQSAADLSDTQSLTSARGMSQSLRSIPVSYRSRQGRYRPRASSMDSLSRTPTSSKIASLNASLQLLIDGKGGGKRESLSSDSSPSIHSDPTDLLRRIRSRSVSPGRRRERARDTASYPALGWVHQLDESVRKSVPSWVGEMSPSEISDSMWVQEGLLEDENNRRPPVIKTPSSERVPSWVGYAEESDVNDEDGSDSSRPALLPMMSTPIKPVGDHPADYSKSPAILTRPVNNCAINGSNPGMNVESRAPSNNGSNSKHVTFTDSFLSDSSDLPPQPQSPLSHLKPPSSQNAANKAMLNNSNNNHRERTRGRLSQSTPQPSRVLDSEYNGEAVLHNSILPQTARLKRSMDNFRESSDNLLLKGRQPQSSPLSPTSSDHSGGSSQNGKACSSLDTVALLTGQPLTRSHRPAQFNGVSGGAADQESSSDGLDGDRSWERLVNTIKAPVPVGSEADKIQDGNTCSPDQKCENTLSGGKQPGSMEALKNMLFRLQAEETSTNDGVSKEEKGEDVPIQSSQDVSPSTMAIIPALENYNFRQEPGGHSLEKALVHLNRLKKLVKTGPSPDTNGIANGVSEVKTDLS